MKTSKNTKAKKSTNAKAKSVGRPRKDASSTPQKRSVGRPRKEETQQTIAKTKGAVGRPSLSSKTNTGKTIPKASVGRPRKNDAMSKNNQNEQQFKKRYVLCFFDPKTHRLVGTYLDYNHATDITGIAIDDIKHDLEHKTSTTGGVWVKSPVGKTINHREINKTARERYKRIKTVKRGRRPIEREVALESVSGINIQTLDDASLKKISRILKSATNNQSSKGSRVSVLN